MVFNWIFSTFLFINCSDLLNSPELVPKKLAIEQANKEMHRLTRSFKDWEGAVVSEKAPVIFYDLEDRPSAYLFTIEKDYKEVGYIAISALKSFFPLLHASTGELPTSHLSEARNLAVQRIGALSGYDKLIYLGRGDYLVEFRSINENKRIFISLIYLTVIPQDHIKLLQMERNEKILEMKKS